MTDIYTKLAAEIAATKSKATGLQEADLMFTSSGLDSFFSDRLLPEDMPKTAYIQADDDTLGTLREAMLDFLGLLRGLFHIHQHAHWTASGDSYYGDHLLFQRLYENIADEIDSMAEKTTAYLGMDVVDAADIVERTQRWVDRWNANPNVIARSLQGEKDFQAEAKRIYDIFDNSGAMTLGFDDFIMAVANAHETHEYLLQQRLQFKASKEGRKAKAASERRHRRKVSSLGDLSNFLRFSKDLLIHKSEKDLWRLTKDADGNHVIEKLYESDVL